MLNLPLLPVTTITKTDGSFFIHNPLTDPKVTDFVLQSAKFKPPIDHTGGVFECTLAGVDTTVSPIAYSLGQTQNIFENIDGGFEILFSVGKTSATTDVFRGMIETVTLNEVSKDYMTITLRGADWGTDIMSGRIVNLFLEQKRLSNGKDPDPADNMTLLSRMTKLLMGVDEAGVATQDAYPGDKDNISNRVTVIAQGISVLNANIVETNKKVPQINFNLTRLNDAISQLNALNGTISYVKPDKTFIQQYPFDTLGVWPSGILLTDNPNDIYLLPFPAGLGWDAEKYGIILSCTTDFSLEGHRKRLLAVDETQGQPDQKQETDSAGQAVDTNFWAMRFTPTKRKCSAVAVRVEKVGTPTVALRVELREDISNTPNGSVVAVSEKLPGSISASADWHYFPVNQNLNTKQNYWIIINPTGDASNYYRWRKDALTANVNADSADGAAWTVRTSSYGFCFRQDFTDDVVTIYPFGITSADKHLWEEIIKKQTLANNYTMVQYLNSQYATLAKKKETLHMTVRSPDTLLQPGMQVKVRKTTSGYRVEGNYVITGLTYAFSSAADMATGTYNLDVTATRFVDYAY